MSKGFCSSFKCIDWVRLFGGEENKETYCGPVSLIIGCCVYPLICFCPIDIRERNSADTGEGFRKITVDDF